MVGCRESHPAPRNPVSPSVWCSDKSFIASTKLLCVKPSYCWNGWLVPSQYVTSWVVGYWHGYLPATRCRFAYGPADTTATHCLAPVNPDWFYLSGTSSLNQPARSTQTSIPLGSLNWLPVLAGWGKDGRQMSLWDEMWHVSSCSSEAGCKLLFSVYFTLLTLMPRDSFLE